MTTSTTLEPTTTNEGFPERFIQVCPSDTFTLFLQASGDAWSCGNNQYGSLGIGREISTQATPKIFARGVRKIGVGKDHAGFIDFQDRLYLWGNGWNGELGVDPQTISTDPENRFWNYPRRVRTSVVDFALGSNRTIYVNDDGRVFATGENTDGVLGTSSDELALREFTQVEGLENITEVDAGINHFGAIDQDGALWTWGSNEFGKLGASSGTDTTIGARKVINGNVRSVSCGEDFTIATLENGRVLVAGKGKWGSVPFFFDVIGEPSRDYGLQEVWGTIDPDIAREMSIIYAGQNEIILTLGAQYSFKFVPNLNGSFRDTKLGRIYFEYTAPNTGTDENPVTRSIFTYLNVSFQETDYLVYEPEDFTLDGWGADGGDGIVLSYNVLQSTTSTTGEPTTTQEVTTTEEVTTSTSTTEEPTTTQEVTTSTSTTSTSTTEEPTTSTSTSTTTSTTEQPTTSSTTEEPTTSTSTSTTSTSTTSSTTEQQNLEVLNSAFAWYDADDSSSIEVDQNGNVLTWRDKTSNSFDVSSPTDNRRPTTGATIGGRGALVFHEFAELERDPMTIQDHQSVYVVAEWDGDNFGFHGLFTGSNPTSESPNSIGIIVDNNDSLYSLSWFDTFFLNGTQVTSDDSVKSIMEDPFIISGSSQNDVTIQGGITIGKDRSYDGRGWEGKISEVIIFDYKLNDADHQIVEGYLAHKWGLSANLPGDHAYKTEPPQITTSTTEEPTTSTSTSTTSSTTSTTEEPTTSTSTSTTSTSTSTTLEPTTSTSTSTTSTTTTSTTTTSTSTTSTTTIEPMDIESSNLTIELDENTSLDLIRVAPGTFTMGQSDISNASPEHEVTLTKAFYLGKYEVTQAQYQAVMTGNSNGLSPTPSSFSGRPDNPVETLSYNNILVFLDRLNEQQENVLPSGWVYDLPTEAEWEYSCRAGTSTIYSWGDTISPTDANYSANGLGETIEVGTYFPNAWGFYDMHGNVYEFTKDAWSSYTSSAKTDPQNQGTTSSERVIRGGEWASSVNSVRSAFRTKVPPSSIFWGVGFRIALKQS